MQYGVTLMISIVGVFARRVKSIVSRGANVFFMLHFFFLLTCFAQCTTKLPKRAGVHIWCAVLTPNNDVTMILFCLGMSVLVHHQQYWCVCVCVCFAHARPGTLGMCVHACAQ